MRIWDTQTLLAEPAKLRALPEDLTGLRLDGIDGEPAASPVR